jgi:acetyl-CoA carboxylase biotin carboxyl carrier protein
MKKIICKAEKKEGIVNIFSPSVGIYHRSPNNGDYLCPGSYIGYLSVLKSKFQLYIPDDISGRTDIDINSLREIRTGYGDPILQILSTENITSIDNVKKDKFNGNKKQEGIIIRSFITGIFYSRETPDSSPFVKVGSIVTRGDTLGLIEVMKSFNKIIFDEGEKFGSGIIEEIFVDNDIEIKMGDPLFRISVK